MMRAGAAMLGVAWVLVAPSAGGQTPIGAPRTLAAVNVIVEMSDGTPVVDLVREDFEVAIDGRVQRIETFSTNDSPVTLVLLVDLTWTVSLWLKPDDLLAAVKSDVVPNLRPGDRIRFGRVESEPQAAPGFLSNPTEMLKAARQAFAIDDERSVGASPLWDATIAAVSEVAREPGRRAVMLVSDGQATGNRHSANDAIIQALNHGVTVHALALGGDQVLQQSRTLAARVRPGLSMEYLADLTGGIFARDVAVPRRPGPHLARVLRNVHRSYTMGFVPDVTEGSARVLRVMVKRPGVTVRAPRRYTGP